MQPKNAKEARLAAEKQSLEDAVRAAVAAVAAADESDDAAALAAALKAKEDAEAKAREAALTAAALKAKRREDGLQMLDKRNFNGLDLAFLAECVEGDFELQGLAVQAALHTLKKADPKERVYYHEQVITRLSSAD